MLPVFVLSLILMRDFGDMLPMFPKGKLIITMSGHVGTQVGMPETLYGGIEKRLVAFNREKIPSELRDQQEGGFHMLLDLFAATITIPIVSKPSDWIDIPEADLENEDGALLYKGRLDGRQMTNPDLVYGYAEIDRLQKILSYHMTVFEKIENQMAVIANNQILDMKEQAENLRKIADNVKRIIYIPKGKSGDAAAEAAYN